MNSIQKIKQWECAILLEDGHNLSYGSIRTLKMIEDELNKIGNYQSSETDTNQIKALIEQNNKLQKIIERLNPTNKPEPVFVIDKIYEEIVIERDKFNSDGWLISEYVLDALDNARIQLNNLYSLKNLLK